MSKKITEDLEFEKNRMEILKRAQVPKNAAAQKNGTIKLDEDQKYAWEYEIEVYRKQKRKEKFFIFGSVCGIISLLLTLLLNFQALLDLF